MFTSTKHNSSTIRFRRWSRAGYAVFNSLDKSISIGCIDIATSDKSLHKSAANTSNAAIIDCADNEWEESSKEKSELELVQLEVLQALVSVTTFDSAAAHVNQLNKYIIIAVEMG